MLAELLNIPTEEEEFRRWAFAHQDQHLKINNAIFQASKVNLPLYILDPMPSVSDPNIEAWGEIHQASHTDFDGILGIAGNDLTSVDFKQPDQMAVWVRLHFDEHNQAQIILGFSD